MQRTRQLAARLLDQLLHQHHHAVGWPACTAPAVWPFPNTHLVHHSISSNCVVQTRGVKKEAAPDKEVKVVLLQNVFRLGRKGEVKSASAGWVRHKLFPRGAALYATPENVARFAQAESAQVQTEDDKFKQVEKQMLSMLRTLAHRTVNVSRKAVETSAAAPDMSSTGEQGEGDSRQQQQGSVNTAEEAGMVGSVTNYDVRQAVLRQLGIQLHESHVLMDAPISSFGTFKVPLNLRMLDDHQVELTLRVNSVKHVRHGKASV